MNASKCELVRESASECERVQVSARKGVQVLASD